MGGGEEMVGICLKALKNWVVMSHSPHVLHIWGVGRGFLLFDIGCSIGTGSWRAAVEQW